MRKELVSAIKQGNTMKFYKSKEWRKKRLEILDNHNGECQKCKGKGKYNKANCVHHILQLNNRIDLALTDGNLISLCNACHNEEHPEKLKQFEAKEKFMNEERWE